jgi:hypothetical protein
MVGVGAKSPIKEGYQAHGERLIPLDAACSLGRLEAGVGGYG